VRRDRTLVLAQTRAAVAVALRTPRTMVFTIGFPLVFLVILSTIFVKGANQTVALPNGLKLDAQAYFTAGIAAYSISLSTFTTLAVTITTQRERGQLKRLRGTPMPAWTFIVAQMLRATAQALAMTLALLAISVVFFGMELPAGNLPGFLLYVALGTATLCGLGIAITPFTPTPDAASTIAPFSVVILGFVSGVWIPIDQLPTWLEAVGRVFPLYHLALGLQTALCPDAKTLGLELGNVAVLAAWGLIGARVAARRFAWEPLSAAA
jgi:ABC-2 type transport system permease protein